jgi:predicted regulator of Ras-like GTPase activity (Roadblock/LC7/MglB family)
LQPVKSVENVLEEIILDQFVKDAQVQSVSIVSKTGLMVAGRAAPTSRTETFSAMAAIIFSSAESTRTDLLKDKVDYVVVVFKSTKMLIAEVSSSLLIVVTADKAADTQKVLDDMQKAITRTKEELVWLR